LTQGLVDPQLQLERMQLVLKRSAEQDLALQAFMAEQIDPSSPNYHHWLEPEEFGRLYGPSDSDIEAVTNWLQNHGFRIDSVSKGRVTIEFSGTVRQVQDAFHTEMHNYVVHGKAHIANDRDPQIPEALAPIVTGVASLHDFFPRHQSELGRYVRIERATHKVTPAGLIANGPTPDYSFLDPNLGVTNEDIGPYDFAAMYNLTPLWSAGITGKGVSIAIAAQTDINLKDVTTFRTFFGLSKFAGTAKIVLNGADPGTIQGSVVENTLDTEWAGASAPDANVLVVVTKGTATSFGGLLSIEYIIDQKLAPVMSASYGECEAGLGQAGNANLNAIYQQGSAEGISIFESAGDQGSTGCDNSDATTYPNPAQNGLQVNGFVSSPYVTGVGGTDIVWQEDAYSKYWTANTSNHASAIGYIPEIPWNSTCTESYLLTYVYTGQTSSEELCNNAIAAGLDDMVRVVGGSGGKSSCLDYTGSLTSCSGAYAKPTWQAGTGVPADKVRDVPDVSLFASSGLPSGNGGSAYLICVSSNSPDNTCDYTGANLVAQEVGGTSVSSPAMSGIMALVVQKSGGAYQGLANPVFYQLAAKETLSACNSNTVANGNSCVFYDVTTGTNAMPCLSGSLNCVVNTTGDQIGIVTGYTTTTGYDLATGLGSVNAYNLVNAWPATQPAVTVTPTTYAFPSTMEGTTSSTTGLVTVKNGGTVALSFSTVSFGGTDGTSFAASTTCPLRATLAAGASCTATISFKAAATGALTATLNIVDGAGTQTVAVSGTGTAATAPAVTLSPTSLTFASTKVGTTTAAQVVTIKNSGTAALTLTSETIAGTNATSFVKSATTCGTSLAAGATCTISVEFKPASTGALTGSLTVADNASGTPQKIALNGTGK
jgi:subtilase family serine protease